MGTSAFFLPGEGAGTGRRFCLLHEAQGRVARGAIVYVHPWAEEMNKSRRMAALQSRAFASAGYTVLQIDLLGCGDSSGDFADATWDAWVDDVVRACRWLRAKVDAPLWLWGLRAGCLLAVDAAAKLDSMPSLLFWQPVMSGKATLQQFLRLKTAASLFNGTSAEAPSDARQELAAGRAIDIAGYRLAPALAAGLERASLAPTLTPTRLLWIEASTRDEPVLLPPSRATIEHWRGAGHEVDALAVKGPAFWQTVEIEDAPALIDASLEALGARIEA